MAIPGKVLKKLQQIAGSGNFSTEREELACYAYDATAQHFLPDAVIFPKNSMEVSAVLSLASENNFFVIPRGAGSGMTGGSLPVKGGVVLVMTRMNKILKIDCDNLIAFAEPGVITGHFHKAVEEKGLFYPPDPASSDFSTLGGNLSECAGGPRAVKYGVTRDYVLGLEAVLPSGEIIKTGVQTAKGVVGYDLTRLLIGSEGTLGVITQMTLRLLPLPKSLRTMTAVFKSMEEAAETVSEIIRQAIIPRTIEFMDHASINCAESYLGIGLPREAGAMLLLEVDGEELAVEADINKLKALCLAQGASDAAIALSEEERANLWKARKSISPALYRLAPDKINEDIVVPKNKIPHMVRKIEELSAKTGLSLASFGHAGDGNIHVNIMIDKKQPDQVKKAEAVLEILFDYTLELGGTISGEHGVGITKAAFIRKEIGDVELGLMKSIKKVFDPKGILNPGKIFDFRKE
ncbi:MAG: FAD-linked oxidase C-terminal domain-containing protein [Desulfobacterales bacterium]